MNNPGTTTGRFSVSIETSDGETKTEELKRYLDKVNEVRSSAATEWVRGHVDKCSSLNSVTQISSEDIDRIAQDIANSMREALESSYISDLSKHALPPFSEEEVKSAFSRTSKLIEGMSETEHSKSIVMDSIGAMREK